MNVDRAAIEALQARGRFGIRLGLGRTRALLAALGSPEASLRGALIGGTNGKGSTQAMVAAIARAAGMRVGQTPKPHLVSYRERIVVDGVPIGPADFARLVPEVLAASDGVARRHGPPTEFEALTAAAFLWFARRGVEVAIVEVGLGGRLDATNAWSAGVAAITNVDRDHMEHLGDTLPLIAREKAAIIKRGDFAVTGATGAPLRVIRRRAAQLNAPLLVAPPLEVVSMDRTGMLLRHPALGPLRLGMLGRHQAANAAVALATVSALAVADIAHVDPAAIRAGMAGVRWPGRLELLAVDPDGVGRPAAEVAPDAPDPRAPDVLLDGAHNAAGAAALAAALGELRPLLSPGPPVLLLGILRDKEVEVMLDALRASPLLADARVIATNVPDAPRSLDAHELAVAWGPPARAVASPSEALEQALDAGRTGNGPLIVAGSLYLVGWVRGRLVPDASLGGATS